MTIQDVQSFVDYVGDGAQTSFAFVFRIDNVAWLAIDFTDDLSGVSLNIDQDSNPGGSVEYLVAPPNLQEIHLQRVIPRTQQRDYQRYDAFDALTHEDALDKLTALIQDMYSEFTGDILGISTALDQLWGFVNFTADRTLQIVDKSKMLRGTATDPTIQTITIPHNSNIDHEIGAQISVYRKGTAAVQWVLEGGVTLNSPGTGNYISRQFGTVTFIKEDTNEWLVAGEIGDLIP